MFSKNPQDDDLIEQLRGEFLDDVRERLDTVNATLNGIAGGRTMTADGLVVIRREAHNIKGTSRTFGFPTMSVVAHRLEDFVADLTMIGGEEINAIERFTDCMQALAGLGHEPPQADSGDWLQGLPMAEPACNAAAEALLPDTPIDVMVVSQSRVVSRMATTALITFGCRVVAVTDPIEGLGMAVRVPPDLVIASAIMNGIGGADLLRALHAISVTRHVGGAIMTSLERGDSRLRGLPADTTVLRLGPRFADDLRDTVRGLAERRLQPLQ